MNSRTCLLLSPWLSAPGLYLIHGYSGTGKTLLALEIACAVASGSKFLKWSAGQPAKVLFVNGEQRGGDLQDYLRAILTDMNLENKSLPKMWFMTSLHQPPGEIDFSTRPWLKMLEEAVISDGIQLIVLNSVGTLCHSKQGKLKAWCLRMCDRGKAVLLIRRDSVGKSGQKTFRKEELFDAIIRLARPEGCYISKGHFRKTRDLRGTAMKDFTIPYY
jgi:putative DNA primase/helicase